ncbi:hypothetical protein CDO46_12765 [Pigmentiphaga sp. NML030171]|nr:hypothetical protein CDO46_12765 [Pigmentiphaga sp. NML030171]
MYAGTGMYSLSEAARLIDVPSRQLNRWLFGYHYQKSQGDTRSRSWSPPLWTPALSTQEFDEKVIGFHDLLEVRFVHAFVQYGVPLLVVRKCLESAQQIWGVKYPFTTLKFKTDGRTIFGEAIRQAGMDEALVDLRNRQHVFREIISPSLYAGIEYHQDQASRWYPLLKREGIVLDPSRQFGSPIVEAAGTPTDILHASYMAEGGNEEAIKATAAIYDIQPRLVRSAVRFEESLRQRVH